MSQEWSGRIKYVIFPINDLFFCFWVWPRKKKLRCFHTSRRSDVLVYLRLTLSCEFSHISVSGISFSASGIPEVHQRPGSPNKDVFPQSTRTASRWMMETFTLTHLLPAGRLFHSLVTFWSDSIELFQLLEHFKHLSSFLSYFFTNNLQIAASPSILCHNLFIFMLILHVVPTNNDLRHVLLNKNFFKVVKKDLKLKKVLGFNLLGIFCHILGLFWVVFLLC